MPARDVHLSRRPMRYEVRAESLGEQAALWLDALPLLAIEMVVPLVKVRAVMAAVRLGVFEFLTRGKLDAESLAERAALEPKALRLLLRVLTASGYLASDGERFWLTALAKRSLIHGSERPLHSYVEFNYAQWQFVEELENTLRVGRGIDFHRTLLHSSAEWRAYQRAMLDLSRPAAAFVAARVPIRARARRLLELGGVHGVLGAAICRAHPPLRSVVLDVPEAIDDARALAIEEGVSDVVEHRACEPSEWDFEAGFDAVLLSNVLYRSPKVRVHGILERIFAALPKGGTLAVWEPELPEREGDADLVRDSLALYFRVTSAGPGYTPRRLSRWLSRSGFEQVRLGRSRRVPGWVLIHARKP